MRYLGIDPGTTLVGYGVLDKQKNGLSLISYGCLNLPKTKKQSERLFFIKNKFQKLLEEYKPDFVSMEKIFFQKNAKTVIEVAQAQGVMLAECESLGLPIHMFTPLEIKIAVAGYGRAEKKQVQQMVKAILKMPEIPKPDDASDALAVAICLAQTNVNLKK
jgi:crossover junction endodeoxyribonuclease RuvC